MIRHKTETEDLLLSLTKNCKTLNKQTHTRPKETLEIKLTKTNKYFILTHQFKLKEIGWLD